MDIMKELLKKKGKDGEIDPDYKKAKMHTLEQIRDMAHGHMGEDVKGITKGLGHGGATVMDHPSHTPSHGMTPKGHHDAPHGLQPHDLSESDTEGEHGMDMEPEAHEAHMKAAESGHEESRRDGGPDRSMAHAPYDDDNMSDDQIDQMIANLHARKKNRLPVVK